MKQDFWADRVVLVTGHTGFKGAWISLWLKRLGARVIGYSLPPPTSPSLFSLARVAEVIDSVEGDVRDFENLNSVINRFHPDVVIHMAAQSLVRHSYNDPVETFSTNVMGIVNVLEAARRAKNIQIILNVTSDKVYENREWIWGFRESDPLGGHDPYSTSKTCSELATAAYRQSFFSSTDRTSPSPAVASARAGNAIGGGDWADDRLIPDIIRAFLVEQAAVVRYPDAVRPWQHVLEPLSGYLMLIEQMWDRKQAGLDQAWNFGPSTQGAKPVRWVVERMINLWGGKASMKLDTTVQPHEEELLSLDCTKARTLLGWAPRLELKDALAWTVDWYKKYQNNDDMRAQTEAQIEHYQSLEMI